MKRALLVLGLLAPPLAHADPEITQAQRNAANDAFQRANWPAAAKAYAPIVAVEDHPALHGRYGTALVEIDKPRDAVPHLEKALAIIPNPRFAFYLARAHARLGEAEAAFAALDRMVAIGGVPVATLSAARDLAALADHKRFADITAKAGLAAAVYGSARAADAVVGHIPALHPRVAASTRSRYVESRLRFATSAAACSTSGIRRA
jgi:tetratricopeptide (TPR) repeat protein